MRVGYIASGLNSNYNDLVWEGIASACAERGASFVKFSGGEYRSPLKSQAMRNFVFGLATPGAVDGILVNTATTLHSVGEDEALAFMERLSRLPIVSIGIKVGEAPAAMTDPSIGVGEMVRHLVMAHGYSRIAFVAGPEGNAESEARHRAFKEALRALGLDALPELFERGNYSAASGAAALSRLLARGAAMDAVVAANDDMAMGLIREAESHGIYVPSDLPVCGFDDVDVAGTRETSLSTVRQPIREQAAAACRALIRQLDGGPIAEDIVLPTAFVRRRTCGCLPEHVERADAALLSPPPGPDRGSASSRGALVDALAGRAWRGVDLPRATIEKVLAALEDALEGGDARLPLLGVERALLEPLEDRGGDFSCWDECVTEMMALTAPPAASSEELRARYHAFWHQARMLIHEFSYVARQRERFKERAAAARLVEATWRLIQCFELERLMDCIAEELPALGIESCYLCVYGARGGESGIARLVLAFDADGRRELPEDGQEVPEGYLLPPMAEGFEEPGSYFVEALFFEDERLGYAVFKAESVTQPIEELRRHISSALKGALLSGEVRKLAEGERARAAQLETALEGLRVSLEEKEALIRELYHRTKNNMGLINALLGLQASISGDEGLREALAETQGRIRTMSLAHDKLLEARDLSRVNLRRYIEDLGGIIAKDVHGGIAVPRFEVDAEDLSVSMDVAVPCGLILNELINNSIKHAFSERPPGTIRACLRRRSDGKLVLRVSDDGVGLPVGFDPERDGRMGMRIIMSLARSQLEGEVRVCGDGGVSFELVFPEGGEN